ncbi:hypothetical protein Tco_0441654 [Tanacetum coccineum]
MTSSSTDESQNHREKLKHKMSNKFKKNVGRDPKGNIIILPPVSAEEQIAVQRETKARTLLLQSLPEDHMADFHHLDDARDIWLAVKARFREVSEDVEPCPSFGHRPKLNKSNHSAAPSHSAFVSTTSGNNKISYAETSKQSSSYISALPGFNVSHFNSGNVMEDVLPFRCWNPLQDHEESADENASQLYGMIPGRDDEDEVAGEFALMGVTTQSLEPKTNDFASCDSSDKSVESSVFSPRVAESESNLNTAAQEDVSFNNNTPFVSSVKDDKTFYFGCFMIG